MLTPEAAPRPNSTRWWPLVLCLTMLTAGFGLWTFLASPSVGFQEGPGRRVKAARNAP